MKTITIPKRFGYPTLDVTVNGKEYTVESGEEITLEDHIAEAIENAIALAPKFVVPKSKLAQLADGSITEITASDLDGIEKICINAFYTCRSVEKVTIPNSVKDIGKYAFYGCAKLESIAMGNSVTYIEQTAFEWCSLLTSVYLPEIPPTLADVNAFANINASCVFYCKTQESLEAYRSAENWNTLAGTYTFKVEP